MAKYAIEDNREGNKVPLSVVESLETARKELYNYREIMVSFATRNYDKINCREISDEEAELLKKEILSRS